MNYNLENAKLNELFMEGYKFRVVRSDKNNPKHSIVLQDINSNAYAVIGIPEGIIGDLYFDIICANEAKFVDGTYLDIHDICHIVSEFREKHPNEYFELNIGLPISTPIDIDNINYCGKTYKESDYIYKFPGDMYMCMVANDCEPDKIYIMVGGLKENDN